MTPALSKTWTVKAESNHRYRDDNLDRALTAKGAASVATPARAGTRKKSPPSGAKSISTSRSKARTELPKTSSNSQASKNLRSRATGDAGKHDAPSAPSTSSTPLNVVQTVARDLGLLGEVKLFGSHASGLRNGNSDCDLVYIAHPSELTRSEPAAQILQLFADALPRYGFDSIVKVFQAAVPLIKAVDRSGTDVDISFHNLLGYHNSQLLKAYAQLDSRVAELIRYVKQWARQLDLIGSVDGHLNSYAFSLLTVFFLMHTSPPVVPNLQTLDDDAEPVWVSDERFGVPRKWNCAFWTEVELLPPSDNTQSVGELLRDFFAFYDAFDWETQAVSIRRSRDHPDRLPTKEDLPLNSSASHWYVEDPFDHSHNLAANSSESGRRRILEAVRQAKNELEDSVDPLASISTLCAEASAGPWFMKTRIDPNKTPVEKLFLVFGQYPVFKIRIPKTLGPESTELFLEFQSKMDRKRTHTLNETCVDNWQIKLFPCTKHAIADAQRNGIDYRLFVVAKSAEAKQRLPQQMYCGGPGFPPWGSAAANFYPLYPPPWAFSPFASPWMFPATPPSLIPSKAGMRT